MLVRKMLVVAFSATILSCASVSAQTQGGSQYGEPAATPAPVVSPGSSYKTIRNNCIRSIRVGNYWDGEVLKYHAVVEFYKGSEGRVWVKFTETGMKYSNSLGTPSYLTAEQWQEFSSILDILSIAKENQQLINIYTYGPNVGSVESGIGNLCAVEEDD